MLRNVPMHRRQALESLVLFSAGCFSVLPRAEAVSASASMRLWPEFGSTAMPNRQELTDSLERCLRECRHQELQGAITDGTEFIPRAATCRLQMANFTETAELCARALNVARVLPETPKISGKSPAFWQACADSCLRCASRCLSAETSSIFENAGRLCSAMVI